MNFSDLLALAWRNLRQSKLRTALTTIGVVVGVGAVVTMVSFGIGLQENLLRDAFTRIDFFTTITVLGPAADTFLSAAEEGRGEEGADGAAAPPPPLLDDEALESLRRLPGVRDVHPQIRFEGYVRFEEKTRRVGMGAAPINIVANPRFEERLAAADAGKDAGPLLVLVRSGKGAFRAVLAGDVVLFGCELRTPLGVALADLGHFAGFPGEGGLLPASPKIDMLPECSTLLAASCRRVIHSSQAFSLAASCCTR